MYILLCKYVLITTLIIKKYYISICLHIFKCMYLKCNFVEVTVRYVTFILKYVCRNV